MRIETIKGLTPDGAPVATKVEYHQSKPGAEKTLEIAGGHFRMAAITVGANAIGNAIDHEKLVVRGVGLPESYSVPDEELALNSMIREDGKLYARAMVSDVFDRTGEDPVVEEKFLKDGVTLATDEEYDAAVKAHYGSAVLILPSTGEGEQFVELDFTQHFDADELELAYEGSGTDTAGYFEVDGQKVEGLGSGFVTVARPKSSLLKVIWQYPAKTSSMKVSFTEKETDKETEKEDTGSGRK